MRLIFIEGVSGVGKTTLMQKLCGKLREKGFSASCYLEGDFTNPIDFYSTAYFKRDEYEALLAAFPNFSEDIRRNTITVKDIRLVRYFNGNTPLFSEALLSKMQNHEFCWNPVNLVPLSEYTRVYKAIWEQFARNADAQTEYMFFDGSLLHHPINDITRNYGVSDKQAADHINTLVEVTRPHHAQVIYLSANNVAERLKHARISRNETPLSKSQIQFWIDRKQNDTAILKQLGVPYDVFDISQENWDLQFDDMLNCILESPEQRRARIYPIILSEYNPTWPQ
jgi:Cdc6-like AAA superfamily ATPase